MDNRNLSSMVRVFFVLFFLFCIVSPLLALETKENAQNQDTIDQFLFKRIKAETKQDDSSIYQELALSYFKQQNFNRSFMYFKKAATLNPKAYWAWYYMGLMNLENPETYFKKAIQANQSFAPPYYWLGRYYCKQKNPKDALKYFQDYIKIAKSDSKEASRIAIATDFVREIKSGETDYEQILSNIETPH